MVDKCPKKEYSVKYNMRFKKVPNLKKYSVSRSGIVKDNETGKELKQYTVKGYKTVSILKDGKWKVIGVHRLVAMAYLPNHNNYPEVNHKNCVRCDNNVENLEWCCRRFNMFHSWKYNKFGFVHTVISQ